MVELQKCELDPNGVHIALKLVQDRNAGMEIYYE